MCLLPADKQEATFGIGWEDTYSAWDTILSTFPIQYDKLQRQFLWIACTFWQRNFMSNMLPDTTLVDYSVS